MRPFLLLLSVSIAAADDLALTKYGPGRDGARVEKGTASAFLEFDRDVFVCGDVGDASVCVDDACANSSALRADGPRGAMSLPFALDAFDTAYAVRVAAGAFCAANASAASPAVAWTARTVPEPVVSDDEATANTSVASERVEVFGLGIIVDDVASIDMGASTFYGDLRVYVLRYYRPFLDAATALREATESSDRGRLCAVDGEAEKWLYVDADAADVDFVNAGKFPKIEPRVDGGGVLDHLRIRSEFYFAPTLARYPFQSQTLPATLELAAPSTSASPDRLLCLLRSYSGFSPDLSSFSSTENDARTLSAKAVVDEAPRRPPYPRGCASQLDYPVTKTRCPPTRATSRLSLELKFRPPRRLGALVLVPPFLIALGSLVSYVLADPPRGARAGTDVETFFAPRRGGRGSPPERLRRLRLQTLATSMLAAVVQHASMRAALPPRAAGTLADDFAYCVYLVIFVALLATVGVMFAPRRRGDAACAGAASVLCFLHVRRPAGLDVSWGGIALLVALATVALLACKRGAEALLARPAGALLARPAGPSYQRLQTPASPRPALGARLLDGEYDLHLGGGAAPGDDDKDVEMVGAGDADRGDFV